MRLYQKTHFTWDEPKQFLRLHDAFQKSNQPKWKRIAVPVSFVAMAASSVITAWDKGFDPSNIATLMFSLGGMVYVSPWAISLFPSQVYFYDDHIARVRGGQRKKIEYTEIEAFSWRVAEQFATLILREKEAEEEIFIGVPLRYPRERVEEFLSERSRRRE